jgi:Ca2+-binding EF-hand superfamily protein
MTGIAAAVVALALTPTCVAASTPAEPNDAEDLLYFAKDRLIILRMHVRVDGKSFTAIWNEYVDSVLADLDKDGDGVLSTQEQLQLPRRNEFVQAGIITRGGASASRSTSADRNRNGKVTRQELGEYFRGMGLRPFSTRLSNQQSRQTFRNLGGRRQQAQGTELFGHLDTNGDGKLSVDEFKSAVKSLHKSDLDDDETISLAELQPLQNPFLAVRVRSQPNPTQKPSFTTLSAAGTARQLVSQLLERYDSATVVGSDGKAGKDGNLSRQELGFVQETFQPFDADENGTLDFDELMQFVRRPPPAVEFVVRLGKRKPNEKLVELVSSTKRLRAGIRTSSAGLVTVVLGETQIEIGVNQQWYQGNQEKAYKARFAAADTDNNAYLEQKEVERNPYFRNTFRLMDRDGDGKVFEEEMLVFVNRISAAASSGTVLYISNAGRNLFEILDLNRDRRLSRRELMAAVARMELWDADGDKHVTKAELPTHFRLTLGRTRLGIFGSTVPAPVARGYAPVVISRNGAGPLWFRKMDRNQDGDVSRREFVGSRKKFEELDADDDGLIDASEALLAR